MKISGRMIIRTSTNPKPKLLIMKTSPMNEVDRYIAGFPDPARKKMEQIRQMIRLMAPEAIETIKYGMPTYILEGNLLHFSAWKKHIGVYPAPAARDIAKEISQYLGAKRTLRFRIDKPLPAELINKVIELRVNENRTKTINTHYGNKINNNQDLAR